MAKGNKVVVAATVVAPQAAVTLYTTGKVPRSGLNQGTKHGQGGTAGTYAAVAALLAQGPQTLQAIKACTTANGDPGFARYAVRMLWVVPVAPVAA